MSIADDTLDWHREIAMRDMRADCDMPRHDTEHLLSSPQNAERLLRSIASLDAPGIAEYRAARDAADAVNQPSHYKRFKIDPVTFAEANELTFSEANVVKYVCRAPYKGTQLEDLRKARRYIDILIEIADRKARIEAGESPEDVWKVML